jgi:hypothetical protein
MLAWYERLHIAQDHFAPVTCKTYFDLQNVGYQYWWLASLLLLALFLSVIWLVFERKRGAGYYRTAFGPLLARGFEPIFGVSRPLVFTCGLAFFTIMLAGRTYSDYLTLSDAQAQGRLEFVEGVVQGFSPPRGQRGLETLERFAVDGADFEYSDAVLTPGFHRTSMYGGPVRTGSYLRIWYYRNDSTESNEIAKLDICIAQRETAIMGGRM